MKMKIKKSAFIDAYIVGLQSPLFYLTTKRSKRYT